MAEKNGIYKCHICGNVIDMIEPHAGTLVCCGQPMELLNEFYLEKEGKEKHVPIIEGKMIKVGSILHPMEEKHWIELIQVFVDGKLVIEKRLYPGDKPELELLPKYVGKKLKARAYCNIHGLWRSG